MKIVYQWDLEPIDFESIAKMLMENEYHLAEIESPSWEKVSGLIYKLHFLSNSKEFDGNREDVDNFFWYKYSYCPWKEKITIYNDVISWIEKVDVIDWLEWIKFNWFIQLLWYQIKEEDIGKIKKVTSRFCPRNQIIVQDKYVLPLFTDDEGNTIVDESELTETCLRTWLKTSKRFRYKDWYTIKFQWEIVTRFEECVYILCNENAEYLDCLIDWSVFRKRMVCAYCWESYIQGNSCSCRQLYWYHSTSHKDFSEGHKYRIGIEIEKSEIVWNHIKLRNEGWGCERDGSVAAEYVTPILNVDNAYDWIMRTWSNVVDGKVDKSCGWHINVSIAWLSWTQVYNWIKYYRPLLWALYPKRATNSYCNRDWSGKYVDFRVDSNLVELRIFPWLKWKKTLKFRIELVKFMLKNPCNSIEEAFEKLISDEFYEVFDIVYWKTMINAMKRVADAYSYFSKMDKETYMPNQEKLIKFITSKKQ